MSQSNQSVSEVKSSSGLVFTSTTNTTSNQAGFERITIDPRDGKLRRLRRSVITTARIIQDGFTGSGIRFQVAFLTLTYAEIEGWSRNDIASFLAILRNHAQRKWGWKLAYVWTMELQERGAPHYHIILWMPRGMRFPMPDKCGWWPHGSTRWGAKYGKVRNPVGYIAKYASKEGLGGARPACLRGARTWGDGGLTAAQQIERSWTLAPKWVKDMFTEPVQVKRVLRDYRSTLQGRYGAQIEEVGKERWWKVGAWLFKSPWAYLGRSAEGISIVWRGWGEGDYLLDGVVS